MLETGTNATAAASYIHGQGRHLPLNIGGARDIS